MPDLKMETIVKMLQISIHWRGSTGYILTILPHWTFLMSTKVLDLPTSATYLKMGVVTSIIPTERCGCNHNEHAGADAKL